MDGWPEFVHPELIAASLAVTLLLLAIGVELVMLRLALRSRAGQAQEADPELLAQHDFYDWLYE